MWQWLRRSFVTGFFVTVPLAVSVVAIVWVFRFVDRLMSGLDEALIGRHIPGLGIITTALIILVVGAVATNVIGRQVVARTEAMLMHVPVFRTIYAPVKQLLEAFSPENEFGFKHVVLVADEAGKGVLGFLTREFSVDRGSGPERLYAVYVPTNHLYIGAVIVYPADRVVLLDLSVEDGLRVFLTGGMGLPSALRGQANAQMLRRPPSP
jgi:uncharacterized membrane protein